MFDSVDKPIELVRVGNGSDAVASGAMGREREG